MAFYLKKIVFVALLNVICITEGYGQRYNFEQYDITDGLIQSQVTAIKQDNQRRLWVATLGGLSCFNGNQFINLGKTNGLNSNFLLSLTLDAKDNLFAGSERGLSMYNSEGFHNFKNFKNWVGKLVTTSQGTVYGIAAKNLFKTKGFQIEKINITKDTSEIITALTTDNKGKLWVSVYKHGLYFLEENKWQQVVSDPILSALLVTDFLVDRYEKDKIWLLTTNGIYISQNGKTEKAFDDSIKKATVINQDEKGNVWIGTSKGAWYINKNYSIYFNAKNGFTDNEVKYIFEDAESNIWLGTDGSGLFKFSGKNYVTFDESQGLQNSIVMSIINGPATDEVWLGTYDGLFVYKDNRIRKMPIPSDVEETKRINFLFKDSKQNIWVGTVGGGLWIYQKKQFRRLDNGNRSVACNAIMEDRDKNIWISTNFGCFVFDLETKSITKVAPQFGTSLLEIAKGYVITGTQEGAYLIRNKKHVTPLNFKPIAGSSILSMLKHGDYIIFGTAENGLIIWNMITGKLKQMTTKDGLFSDHVYSLLLDRKGVIWTGTGRGINRLNGKNFNILKDLNENASVVECNQNAILEQQQSIWIGTTKGAIVYDNNKMPTRASKPFIFITSANVLPQHKKGDQNNLQVTYKEKELNKKIALHYNSNHINISFTGIYLTNPKGLMYKYRLIGLDTKDSSPTSNTSVNYTALPPGKYTFQVKAINSSGIESANTAKLDFEIIPPYYQTTIFKIFILSLIMLLIMLSVYIIINLNERQRKLRLKIKLEEQFKIRKQTAEDFHDDLGNKLTRISVLSEVLNSMLDKSDLEKKAIIERINTNVNELYTGTKDILWSLNPKHDTLYELLAHISEFGQDMFNDTSILFESDTPINDTEKRLPLELSRNILMIFKEAIHNALKHAKADHVIFRTNLHKDTFEIQLKDNGTGFDADSSINGHGINNMDVRAQRINGILNIKSDHNGTTITLSVKLKKV